MCNYCQGEVCIRKNVLFAEGAERNNIAADVYIDADSNLVLDGYAVKNKINFCPMCGRKLGDI